MSITEYLTPDSFNNADDYIIFQLSKEQFFQNCISKETLIMLAEEYGVKLNKDMKKSELAAAVYKSMGKDIFEYCEHTGIPDYAFMCKYRLLPDEIRDFSKVGLLEITGRMRIYRNGKGKNINLYSPYQYYGLNDKTISEWREKVYGKRA